VGKNCRCTRNKIGVCLVPDLQRLSVSPRVETHLEIERALMNKEMMVNLLRPIG